MFLDESAFDVDDTPTMIVPKLSTSNPVPSIGGGGRYGNAAASSDFSRPGSSAGLGGTSSSTSSSLHAAMALMNVDDDMGNGDSSPNPSGANSRARMLAQQRELQLKKRQSAIQSGGMFSLYLFFANELLICCFRSVRVGMVRSSIDNDEGGSSFRAPMGSSGASSVNSSTSQFTPAIRQFSAPKAVKETFA
jgi:hypothetical protein